MSLSLPTTYLNRYVIRRPIGEGAFSHTFLAHDTVLERDVALKVLRQEHRSNDEFSARFDREAQAAALVSHPNVVPVFDFGREQGLPFIVMQFIDGRTLRQFDRDEGPLTIEEVVDIGRQVLDGLAAIHDQGIVHRDVKPQNVLLDNRMGARLTDFGVAYLANELTLTKTGTTIGTAAYMAPEQATGQNVGPGADLYSVGVMLYELLTRRLPFRGDNPVQVLYRHVSDLPDRPRDLNPQIPIDLEAVILRALAKIPAERYPDARTMRDALAGQRKTLPPPVTTETVQSEPRRFRTPAPLPADMPTRQQPAHVQRLRTRKRWAGFFPILLVMGLLLMAAVGFAVRGLDFGGGAGDDASGAAVTPSEVEASGGIPGETAAENEASPEESAASNPASGPTETPEPAVPTSTNQPAPTDEPTRPTQPPDDGGGAPTVSFNSPFRVSALPPAWNQGNRVTFGRDDFVAGGAYRRDDGVLYDRPAAHLYSRSTDFPATTISFEVQGQPELPDSHLAIVITGMDDELPGKVPCRITLNDHVVWEGESPFMNESWTRVGWQVGSLDWLVTGRNQLTFEVLVEDGDFGLPPWILLTEAEIYWD
ncbi:Stk1 family PASTA domain-containing Ser/Thr kinase [soil metagenome]